MKKTIKLLLFTFILVVSFFIMGGNSKAASTSFSADSTTVEVGDTIRVSASITAAQWSLQITADGTQIASSNELDNYESNITESFSGTFTAKAEGTVTFRLTGDITDVNQTNTTVDKTLTVTVKAKETSSGGDSGNNGSSGNNSSGSDSDDNENTPSVSFSSRNETVYATGSVNVRASYSTSSRIIGSLEEGDSLTRTGISDEWSRVTYEGQTAYVINSGLTTTKPATEEEQDEENTDENDENKSNVKTLSSLTVEQYSLEPEFNPDITEYSLTVGGDVEKLDIGAIAEDTNATIEITGNTGFLIGENTVNVKVTAEDGTVRTYTINVTKLADVGVKLSELSVENYTLSPEFSSDVFEYTLNITDTSITNLTINAKSDEENVDIEIVGNNELKLGKNIITILVTSEADNLTTTYQIVVNIDEAYKQNTQIIAGIDDKDLYMYIGIGVAVLIILIIIIVVIARKRRNAKQDEEEDEDFAPLNTYSLDNFSNDDKSAKLENTDLDSNKDATTSDEIEKDKKSKKRKEKLEEFSSYASSTDSDTNTTSRRKGKHF